MDLVAIAPLQVLYMCKSEAQWLREHSCDKFQSYMSVIVWMLASFCQGESKMFYWS